MINRQAGSGTRHFTDQQFSKLGIDGNRIQGYDEAVTTHLEVGFKVLRHQVDAGIATGATARLLGLDFVPLTNERFDIVIPKARFFSPGVQTLLEIVGSREFRERVESMGGYDTSDTGRLITVH
jgi:putative molybdopterin biosynthesis protein